MPQPTDRIDGWRYHHDVGLHEEVETCDLFPACEYIHHHRGDPEPEVCVAGHLLGAMGWTAAGVAACVTAIVAWWRRR